MGRLELCCQKQGTARSQERGLEQTFPRAFRGSVGLSVPRSRTSSLQSWRQYTCVILATQSVVLCYDSLRDVLQRPQAWIEMMQRAAVQDSDQTETHCGRGCDHCCLPGPVQSLAKAMACQVSVNCVFKQSDEFLLMYISV